MNTYRNILTGVIIEIPSEFGDDKVWKKISSAPVAKEAEPKETKATAPKKATKKAVKK